MENKELFSKIYGCFLGKSIGGSIGGEFEGKKEFLKISYKLPDKILPNDDLDLQLVWLDILKKKGIRITSLDLAEGWKKNIDYPFDEYGVAKANLKIGLNPPITGIYNNWFYNCMGAPIRSEIWACIFSGKPEIAGHYAYIDSSVDHWYEGVYGEIFLVVLESIAFIENDIEKLIIKSCEFLPEDSKIRKVSEMVLKLYKEGKSLEEIREKIIEKFGHYNFTDCVQNIGFIISGLLFGKGNFLKTIIDSIKCGYDTDCTGATSGAIIGIILGKEEIEKQVKTKIDERIIAGWGIKDVYVPENINDLTEEILKIKEIADKEKDLPKIEKPFKLPEINDFEKPLNIEFEISEVFKFDEVENLRNKIINGDYNNFKKFLTDSFYIPTEKIFNGKNGVIFLKTKIKNEKRRKIKFFPSSNDGIKMWINKKLVLSHHFHNHFLPAPHRPGSPIIEEEIDKGEYEILIEVSKCNNDLEFAFILADERNHLIYDFWKKGVM